MFYLLALGLPDLFGRFWGFMAVKLRSASIGR